MLATRGEILVYIVRSLELLWAMQCLFVPVLIRSKTDVVEGVATVANSVVYTVISAPWSSENLRTPQFVRGMFLTHLVMRSCKEY